MELQIKKIIHSDINIVIYHQDIIHILAINFL